MAYAASGNTTPVVIHENGRLIKTFVVTETEASSAAEYTIRVPKVGTILLTQWELTTPGASSTMQLTFRTATGAWDGSGANSNKDVNRESSGTAQGQSQTSVKYYAPAGTLYVRSTLDSATTNSTVNTTIVIQSGA